MNLIKNWQQNLIILVNNSNGFNSIAFSSFKNNPRKDAKGNLITKINHQSKKSKHHPYIICFIKY